MDYLNCHPQGMALNAAGTVSSKCPLDQTLARLESAAALLSHNLDEHNTRLEPLLSQNPAKNAPPAVSPPAGSSLLVEKLHQITTRLEFMIEILANIHNRLEV